MSDRVHHEPIRRASEVVAFEIALTVGQAYLAGVCIVLALQPGQIGLASIVLGALGVAAVTGYGLWLFGGPGTLMALANVPLLLLSLFALLVSFQPATTGVAGTIVRSDALGVALQLVAVVAASIGIVGGAFLPGPRRLRWHHAGRPATIISPSRKPGIDALAERVRAPMRQLKSSIETRRARTASVRTAGREQASPSDEGGLDEDGMHELSGVDGPEDPGLPQAADAEDTADAADARDDDAPYRPRQR